MAPEKTGVRVKRCVVCGKEFEVRNARDAKREYCDYNSPCRRRWNLMREREKAERERLEASQAQAHTADLLAHAEAKLIRAQEEYAKAHEAWCREHEMLGKLIGQINRMLHEEIMVLNPSSPHWESREEFAWAMGVIADWKPDGDPTMPADEAGLRRKLAQADEDYRRAIAEGDVDAAGAAERRNREETGEWWRTHPEQWAQYNISMIRQAYREDHDGEEMPYDAVECEWYRKEARRRRAALDAKDDTNISDTDRPHMG